MQSAHVESLHDDLRVERLYERWAISFAVERGIVGAWRAAHNWRRPQHAPSGSPLCGVRRVSITPGRKRGAWGMAADKGLAKPSVAPEQERFGATITTAQTRPWARSPRRGAGQGGVTTVESHRSQGQYSGELVRDRNVGNQ